MTDLTELLIQEGLVTRDQVKDAKDKQVGAKKPLQELLIEMGFISEETLMKAVSKAFDTPLLADNETSDPEAAKLIPCDLSRRLGVLPIRKDNGKLILAMSNPVDVIAIDAISNLTKLSVEPVLASKSRIIKMIEENFQVDDILYDILKNFVSEAKIKLIKDNVPEMQAMAFDLVKQDNSFMIKLVNVILGDAVKMRATDIHIEPQEDHAAVRYRIDGYLKNILNIPKDLQTRFIAHIKILADLDVSETRRAQDGRIKIQVNERGVDLRINVIPTFYGEKIAIRLLDHEEAKVLLDKVGFEQEELQRFTRVIQKPQGMILVTGPTGSGKTSTLYAALNFVKSETKHIITIEDPVEYLIDGVNQIQLNPSKDVTFATSLRSILRQDPNIIFVGEIRDKDTAEIAFQAAQTGHLVFSTLHTMNSVASITRLIDIGLESYLISSSLIMVVAQRLVRLICPHCKEEYTPDAQELDKCRSIIEKAGLNKFYRGKGCQQCNFTGFSGRTAVFEIMEVNDKIRSLINERAQEKDILQEAQKNGLRTLADSAAKKVAQGLTTIQEIARVVDVAKGEKAAETEAPPRKTAKLLIVDDEDDLLVTLEQRLHILGYDVVKAYDGAKAVEMAYKEKPDLIIMDVNMPNMDGFEATKVLRSKLETASIPIMLLTARQDKDSELAGFDSGADDYIVKPYDKDKLLARVKMLLKKR